MMNDSACNKSKSIQCAVGSILLLLAAWFYLAFSHHMLWPGKCTGVNMKVEGGEVKGAQLEGDHLAITADFPSQHVTKVILYDFCSGKVLSAVEAAPGTVPR